MMKKHRSKNKKKSSRSYTNKPYLKADMDDESESSTGRQDTRSTDNSAFIDHRKHGNLKNIQYSPKRTRRRRNTGQSTTQKENSNNTNRASKNASLPLTDRNLYALNMQQGANYQFSKDNNKPRRSIAIDMDKFREENHKQNAWGDEFDRNNSDRYSVNTMEFGESNPSSEDSGDSTSLDDVCFPDYYNDAGNFGNRAEPTQWPDLKILEEFIRDEIEEYTNVDHKRDQSVNFNKNIATTLESSDRYDQTSFQASHMAEAKEDSPLLHNAQINEAESVYGNNESLRIRPQSIQPWEKSKVNVPTILQNPIDRGHSSPNSKSATGVCRYTYFREDLNETIHSPTISGLLQTDLPKSVQAAPSVSQERQKLDNSRTSKNLNPKVTNNEVTSSLENAIYELFQPSYYNLQSSSSNNSVHGTSTPVPQMTAQGPQTETKNGRNLDIVTSGPDTATNSFIVNREEEVKNPFWLDVLDPTEEEMKVLSKTFGIHPLTTEDIFLGEAREKVELFKSYYFICFTSFDIVYERRIQRAKEHEKKLHKLQEMLESQDNGGVFKRAFKYVTGVLSSKSQSRSSNMSTLLRTRDTNSNDSKNKKLRQGELMPLNMYMIVFKSAVITFHFSPTPHPINVRRRARLLSDYLTVSSDWICYALIDDITDSFAPMIDSIETEVNQIEDAILKMHSGDSDDSDDSDDSEDDSMDYSLRYEDHYNNRSRDRAENKGENAIFFKRRRARSVVDHDMPLARIIEGSISASKGSRSSQSGKTSKVLAWKRKGDMLRRIGECRKRVMSILRLLGSKADVIRGFSKRFNEQTENSTLKVSTVVSPSPEIGMYLGDIQDHIVTMVQSLNHYEKLLARFHSNYLAQINIDMTKVNNDTNDVLGRITILGTIVLPVNVVTGLWGMNCMVPGQDYPGTLWFWSIVAGVLIFSIIAYNFAKRITGL